MLNCKNCEVSSNIKSLSPGETDSYWDIANFSQNCNAREEWGQGWLHQPETMENITQHTIEIFWNRPILSFLKGCLASMIFSRHCEVLIYEVIHKFCRERLQIIPRSPFARFCFKSSLISFQLCLRLIWKWYS